MARHVVVRKSKGVTKRTPKTSRVEMDSIHRAIACQMEADGHTCKSIGERFGRNTSTISEMIKRVKKRAEEEGLSMLDPALYKTKPTRGRTQKLSPYWKRVLIDTVMASHENRKARPAKLLQVLPEGFPEVSTSCLESALYEAHFRRVNHLWKSSAEDEYVRTRLEAEAEMAASGAGPSVATAVAAAAAAAAFGADVVDPEISGLRQNAAQLLQEQYAAGNATSQAVSNEQPQLQPGPFLPEHPPTAPLSTVVSQQMDGSQSFPAAGQTGDAPHAKISSKARSRKRKRQISAEAHNIHPALATTLS